jgi:hypothetical protein
MNDIFAIKKNIEFFFNNLEDAEIDTFDSLERTSIIK